jgi:hypothetical protein
MSRAFVLKSKCMGPHHRHSALDAPPEQQAGSGYVLCGRHDDDLFPAALACKAPDSPRLLLRAVGFRVEANHLEGLTTGAQNVRLGCVVVAGMDEDR